MTEPVTVTSLTVRRHPEPNTDGSITLAFFTAEIGEVTLRGCGYIRRLSGQMTVNVPGIASGGERRAVFVSDRLRAEMVVAARAAYRALGGNSDGFTEEGQAAYAERQARREAWANESLADGLRRIVRSQP